MATDEAKYNACIAALAEHIVSVSKEAVEGHLPVNADNIYSDAEQWCNDDVFPDLLAAIKQAAKRIAE